MVPTLFWVPLPLVASDRLLGLYQLNAQVLQAGTEERMCLLGLVGDREGSVDQFCTLLPWGEVLAVDLE